MNPPTSGHMLLVKTMITKALGLIQSGKDAIVGIILSHTIDDDKNPLSCEEKRDILLLNGMIDAVKSQMKQEYDEITQSLIDNIRVVIYCKDDDEVQEQLGNFPIQSINALVGMYSTLLSTQGTSLLESSDSIIAGSIAEPLNINMHLVVGEDRAASYNWLISSLAKKTPPVSLTIQALPRPEGAMSATAMRALVKEGNLEQFLEKMRETGLGDEQSERIFRTLHDKINTAKRTRKKGGKRRKRTRKQKRRRRRRDVF